MALFISRLSKSRSELNFTGKQADYQSYSVMIARGVIIVKMDGDITFPRPLRVRICATDPNNREGVKVAAVCRTEQLQLFPGFGALIDLEPTPGEDVLSVTWDFQAPTPK